MSQIEKLDIFNDKMIKIGVETREKVHSRGLWHQTFHCWVINKSASEGGSLLLQLRHNDKDTYPGLLDISCAGHLQFGETIEDGVRELGEELGISVSFNELTFCGMVAQENVISNDLIDREFNHIFIYEINKPLEEYNFQTDEISGLFFVNIKDFKRLLSGEVDAFWIEGVVIDEVNQQMQPERREMQEKDLSPNSSEYYEVLFDTIDVFIK